MSKGCEAQVRENKGLYGNAGYRFSGDGGGGGGHGSDGDGGRASAGKDGGDAAAMGTAVMAPVRWRWWESECREGRR